MSPENGNTKISSDGNDNNSYNLKIFQSCLNLLAHTLIGAISGISILFALKDGLPLTKTQLHIILCVLGYQLLMSQAFLALSADNGWSLRLRFVDKRRAHWIIQVLGSGMALAGSIIIFIDKDIHFNTLHGQFGLVAVVFTILSFFNGVTSLYAYEWRRFIPANVSKISHICFGMVAYGAASLSLCYGFDKGSFTRWATPALAYTCIAFTAAFTFIILINPSITFFNKSRLLLKK